MGQERPGISAIPLITWLRVTFLEDGKKGRSLKLKEVQWVREKKRERERKEDFKPEK